MDGQFDLWRVEKFSEKNKRGSTFIREKRVGQAPSDLNKQASEVKYLIRVDAG